MKDVYLNNDNGSVRAFYSQEDMEAAGFSQADKVVTEEEFNSNGCYTRVIEDEIIIGRTQAEIAAEEKQLQVDTLKNMLTDIDRAAGAGRAIRAVTLEAAQVAGLVLPAITVTDIAPEDDDITRLCKYEAKAEAVRNQLGALTS